MSMIDNIIPVSIALPVYSSEMTIEKPGNHIHGGYFT
jgi:hypothetical protein